MDTWTPLHIFVSYAYIHDRLNSEKHKMSFQEKYTSLLEVPTMGETQGR